MKKFLTMAMIAALVLVTGCGASSGGNTAQNGELKLGMIRHLNITETLLDNYFQKAASRMAQTADMRAPKHIFFDNMPSMIAALQSGQVDEISTYVCVAGYLIAQNNDLEIAPDRVPKVSDAFCCALREEDTALKKEFDDAILKLKENGTLKTLVQTYISDADFSKPFPAVEMPHFDGAPTIKIAVTGDLPPLDLITADGQPSGFNTAILAEISQLIGKNFELINVDSGARAVALTSKKVDVIFWVAVPLNDTLAPPDSDTPQGAILTESYFSDEIAHVKLKK